MTFVPDSVKYICPSVKMMINEGCKIIHCNFAYEPVYTKADASNIYFALKELSDWLIENKSDVYITMLNDDTGHPMAPGDNHNYCGGTGSMLSLLLMEKLIHVFDTLLFRSAKRRLRRCASVTASMDYTRQNISRIPRPCWTLSHAKVNQLKECFECPVAMGCGGCSGYNYECFGTPNHRSTNICLAHKGRVLASYYYANKRFIELGDVEPRVIYMPYNEVVDILGEKIGCRTF